MSENLDASAELVTMGSVQAALFEDPTRLLNLSDAEMAQVVADLHGSLGQVMPGIRRAVGMVAWAQWHRLTEGKYHGWLDDTANLLGVDTQTVIRWRRKAVAAEQLAVPTVAAQRQLERKTAGQAKGPDKMIEPSRPRPGGPEAAPAPPGPDRNPPGPVPSNRGHIAGLLAALRSVDPADLGPAMTPEEVREVRDFAAALVTSRGVTGSAVPARPVAARPPAVRSFAQPTRGKRTHNPSCTCAMCAEAPKGAKR